MASDNESLESSTEVEVLFENEPWIISDLKKPVGKSTSNSITTGEFQKTSKQKTSNSLCSEWNKKNSKVGDEINLPVVCQKFSEMSTVNSRSNKNVGNQDLNEQGLLERGIFSCEDSNLGKPQLPGTLMISSEVKKCSPFVNLTNTFDGDNNACCARYSEDQAGPVSESIAEVCNSSSPDKIQNISTTTTDTKSCSEEYSASESDNCHSSCLTTTSITDTDTSLNTSSGNESFECENSVVDYEASAEESAAVNVTEDNELLSTTSSSSSSSSDEFSDDNNTSHENKCLEQHREIVISTTDSECSSEVCRCCDYSEMSVEEEETSDSNVHRCYGCGRSISDIDEESKSSVSGNSTNSSPENARNASAADLDIIGGHWYSSDSETTSSSVMELSTEDSAIIVCNCCDCYRDCLVPGYNSELSDDSISFVDVGTSTDDVAQHNSSEIPDEPTSIYRTIYVNILVTMRLI